MTDSTANTQTGWESPPKSEVGVIGWMRKNLFSNWFNSFLTILAIYLLVTTIPGIIQWAFIDSIWGDNSPDICREAQGACWSFIYEKHRFILFGVYTFDEHWRPLVAMIIFLFLIFASCLKPVWRLGWWILAGWGIGLVFVGIFMWGGVFGMTYVDQSQWGGLPLTLFLATFGTIFAFPIGIFLALGRRSKMPIIRSFSVAYIELIRGVPLISILFMASVMFPLFLPAGVSIDKLLRAQVGIILFGGAYAAEIIRGGLQAIPRGQYEAADAMGLTYWQSMLRIILPQALRITIPPMVNGFIGGFKDTSLVVIIGLFDLLMTSRVAFQDINWRPFFVEGYLFCAMIYFCFCFFMSRYSMWLEKDLSRGHNH
ncbi:MAG: amino acid ABC transporter permease [Rhodospirillales bacterium]|nr:amino acid ABC transporter permease [Rhodospirillales bacterium]